MYQYAYLYENIDNNFAKTLINENAYVEGYAVYAQYESFKYLDNMNQKLLQLFKENELASYCLVIGADIGIHYEGWDLTQFTDYMSEFGLHCQKKRQHLYTISYGQTLPLSSLIMWVMKKL